jgi:uncharacterized iron-regulated membrane protein
MGFFTTMFKLHRWLLDTNSSRNGVSIGKFLVGTSTLLLVIILLTGLVLWLMHPKKNVKISVRNGLPRFLHDLHVSGGVYATIFLLALALTGLTWSFNWYRTGFYNLFGVESSTDGHGGHGGQGGNRGGQGGRGGNHGRPEGKQEFAHHGGTHHGGTHHGGTHHGGENRGKDYHGNVAELSAEGAVVEIADSVSAEEVVAPILNPFVNWQTAVDNVVAANPNYRQVSVSDGMVALIPAGRNSLRASDDYSFDAATGAITAVTTYDSKDKADKMRGTIYCVHTGSWGGIITRILTMLAALLGATLPITGYYIWIKHLRRKKGK